MINKTNTIVQSNNLGRFLIKVIFLSVLLLFISCDKDDIEKEEITSSFEIKIDNDQFKFTNGSVGAIENCERISVGVQSDKSAEENFTIVINLLKNGGIGNVQLFDYRFNNNPYETPDFKTDGLLTVSNFEYDEAKKYLHFEYEGELLKVETDFNSLDKNQPRKKINGVVTINDIQSIKCDTFISQLNFTTNTLIFFTNRPCASHDPNLKTNPYQFSFLSTNGYRAIIKSSKDLWNLDKGTYAFEQNSLENRIDLEQYIGIFRATQLLWIRPQDWKKFQTSGSYTIKEHLIINGLKVTKGQINLQVYDNGMLLHSISNGKFEVVGF
ncbi:hypothetical protein SAMN05444395_101517 [Flavobacterium fryxellicola]|nr:hypothetical protein [Flavobacterium fryxellicola]SHN53379.1 hypothetical protein SAMN05444395_101517 [Flavobacterium fryxellicola]